MMGQIKQMLKHIIGRRNPEEAAMEYCLQHGFRAGECFSYNSGYPIDSNYPWLISVGDSVTLATGVKLLAHDASTVKAGAHTKIGIVRIGSNVFIGANSIVLCDTRIGDNVIIGAGSVVTHDIPSNSVYAGNPARYICSFDEFKGKKLEQRRKSPIFDQHPWYEWAMATEAEWKDMREKLENGPGYLL